MHTRPDFPHGHILPSISVPHVLPLAHCASFSDGENRLFWIPINKCDGHALINLNTMIVISIRSILWPMLYMPLPNAIHLSEGPMERFMQDRSNGKFAAQGPPGSHCSHRPSR